jgi:rhomboid family GlyGly-CTERM serine protease
VIRREAQPVTGRRAGRGSGGVPGVSLGLTALAGFLWLVPAATPWLEYDRAALAAGQLWRLVTAHWTHWSADHLGWDLLAFALLGALCERESRSRFLLCVLGGAGAVSLAVWGLLPAVTTYRGLSGLDSALFVLLAVSVMRAEGEPPWRLGAGAAALVLFQAKILYEIWTGTAVFVQGAGLDVAPIPLAHLAGAAVGFAVGLAPDRLFDPTPAPTSAPAARAPAADPPRL